MKQHCQHLEFVDRLFQTMYLCGFTMVSGQKIHYFSVDINSCVLFIHTIILTIIFLFSDQADQI